MGPSKRMDGLWNFDSPSTVGDWVAFFLKNSNNFLWISLFGKGVGKYWMISTSTVLGICWYSIYVARILFSKAPIKAKRGRKKCNAYRYGTWGFRIRTRRLAANIPIKMLCIPRALFGFFLPLFAGTANIALFQTYWSSGIVRNIAKTRQYDLVMVKNSTIGQPKFPANREVKLNFNLFPFDSQSFTKQRKQWLGLPLSTTTVNYFGQACGYLMENCYFSFFSSSSCWNQKKKICLHCGEKMTM